ncbi:MAG: 30S ribosomal protein S21 [Spirochaetes bacterium]|nr:30S ribosomal protein S21 [Spirochaetota bacterium]NLJ05213.1 30S ribosomal protein S21 [Exilispira sp.]MBP8990945.1 30S ribosomal protein S21 [Spirochaetota bacterium]HNV43187.1 30S ribosomal protein S21 [Exilispira sp.]HOV46160.1 30S ribosomal protein S21 [Exilispira sp.]
MARVYSSGDDSIEVLLKRFKRECERESILREWKRKEFYVKPAENRKVQKKALERKRLKKQRKLEMLGRRKK